jgi:DNA-binding MarR family transcriptional regulator
VDKYFLSNEGRARFARMRISLDTGDAKFEGFEILAYLYDHGSSTAAELTENTGLSRSQLMDRLLTFIHHGFIEGIQ